MKKVIKVTDVDGKVYTSEVKVRDLDHFEVQRTTRMNIFRDRTKYRRKIKHKHREW